MNSANDFYRIAQSAKESCETYTESMQKIDVKTNPELLSQCNALTQLSELAALQSILAGGIANILERLDSPFDVGLESNTQDNMSQIWGWMQRRKDEPSDKGKDSNLSTDSSDSSHPGVGDVSDDLSSSESSDSRSDRHREIYRSDDTPR